MLSQEVEERLELLLSSNQIQSDTMGRIKDRLSQWIENDHLDQNSEHFGPFTSHLAIAVQRIKAGKGLTQSNDEVEEITKQNPTLHDQATQYLTQCLSGSTIQIPQAEIGFITLYLYLLQNATDK